MRGDVALEPKTVQTGNFQVKASLLFLTIFRYNNVLYSMQGPPDHFLPKRTGAFCRHKRATLQFLIEGGRGLFKNMF